MTDVKHLRRDQGGRGRREKLELSLASNLSHLRLGLRSNASERPIKTRVPGTVKLVGPYLDFGLILRKDIVIPVRHQPSSMREILHHQNRDGGACIWLAVLGLRNFKAYNYSASLRVYCSSLLPRWGRLLFRFSSISTSKHTAQPIPTNIDSSF